MKCSLLFGGFLPILYQVYHLCNYTKQTKTFTSYAIQDTMNCSSTHVVYLICCEEYTIHYVGCTRSQVLLGIFGAFMQEILPALVITVITTRKLLLIHEAFWILKLGTCNLTGLNQRQDLMYLYRFSFI